MAHTHFLRGLLNAAINLKPCNIPSSVRPREHLGSSRRIKCSDLLHNLTEAQIVFLPPAKGLARVTLTRDDRMRIEFSLCDVEYKGRVVLNTLVVKKIGFKVRARSFLYRINGGTIMGNGITFKEVQRDDDSVSALANAMLAGKAGADAAEWLFKKIVYSEARISNDSIASYVPDSSDRSSCASC